MLENLIFPRNESYEKYRKNIDDLLSYKRVLDTRLRFLEKKIELNPKRKELIKELNMWREQFEVCEFWISLHCDRLAEAIQKQLRVEPEKIPEYRELIAKRKKINPQFSEKDREEILKKW